MSLTDEQLLKLYSDAFVGEGKTFFAGGLSGLRAIESAATAPLLERIKGLLQEVAKGADVEAEQRSRIADLERQLEQARKDAEPRAPEQLDAGAKKLAELFDYPWAHMPEQGRQTMRNNVISVLQSIDAAISKESK
jgi:hypothetical protein